MLATTVFAADGSSERLDDPDLISERLGADRLVWVDVAEPDEEDLARIREEFSLHPLAVDAVRERGQRPRIDRYPTHAFIVGYAHDRDPADLPEVGLFVGAGWLVSVRARSRGGELFDVAPVRRRFELLRQGSVDVGLLLYALLDDLIDGYFAMLDANEDLLERIEAGLFDGAVASSDELAPELLRLRRQLLILRRRVVPMREVVLALLRREVPWVGEASIVYLQDVFDHLLRIVDQIDTQRELLGNVVDANLGLIANRTNEVMKKTSSWGAILIAATLIAGIYGMNFDNMPELRWQFGYPAALASMVGVTGGLWLYFRRKRWL